MNRTEFINKIYELQSILKQATKNMKDFNAPISVENETFQYLLKYDHGSLYYIELIFPDDCEMFWVYMNGVGELKDYPKLEQFTPEKIGKLMRNYPGDMDEFINKLQQYVIKMI